jgi:hypothetical protein
VNTSGRSGRRTGQSSPASSGTNGIAGVELHVDRDGGFLFSQRHPDRAAALRDADETKTEYLADGGTLVG